MASQQLLIGIQTSILPAISIAMLPGDDNSRFVHYEQNIYGSIRIEHDMVWSSKIMSPLLVLSLKTIVTLIFSDHLGNLELAAMPISSTGIQVFTYGIFVCNVSRVAHVLLGPTKVG
ncbi:hypothetical protein NE237_010894 [Protea cynaroides]|uniref:Uncharacterized protein n=1 Tax=Protea cynaroides TaxID=273540 RepID=A0A9Q0R206_9MAGN|nr:hypothetical protein NE237_010894 [Protea cynaroides]